MATIKNKDGSLLLAISDQPKMAITIGKPANANEKIKVGDKVYLRLEFTAIPKLAHNNNETLFSGTPESFFETFFWFETDDDDDELAVELIKVEDARGNELDFRLKSKVQFGLTYLIDFTELESGEKIIYVMGSDSTSDLELAISEPFYLHQSFSENLQRSISNEGLSSDAAGLSRENLNYPKFLPVGLQPGNPLITKDIALWETIRDETNAMSFKKYLDFMNFLFCNGKNPFALEESKFHDKMEKIDHRLALPFTNVDSYRALKVATEAFVMTNLANSNGHLTGYLSTVTDSRGPLQVIPYLAIIRKKLSDLDFKSTSLEDALQNYILSTPSEVTDTCFGLITERLQNPCYLELIWSYWHEESMMVQGINTICRRFQNIKGDGAIDPLANVEIGPLRPLNSLLWGYIQDEQHRLTVRRRAYEYDHHYGLSLEGKAVTGMRTADTRSKFIEAFHTLLNLTTKFYHQYDDTTVVADGFPIMNALKEVHMILSEGAHNQYGDLPSTARIEMLMQQFILARPEFREFLPTRQMVPYPEPWMDRAAVLNQMHNWTKTNVMHFHDLGVFGEQIVLSIRFGAWSEVFNRDQAANWAIFWRPQIQNYIHAYRAVTGADLSREDGAIDTKQPSVHLLRRLNEQNNKIRA